MAARRRACADIRGNCTQQSDDGLPAQCVGEWVPNIKHVLVRRFIDASRGARSKWLGPGKAGAVFIDLFAGPGRGRVRGSGLPVEGSSAIALNYARSPFTRVIAGELDPVNVAALRQRTLAFGDRRRIVEGDCNVLIDEILSHAPQRALGLALIDPYGLRGLSFETIRKLAKRPYMDLIIHFPTGDIKRNFRGTAPPWLDRALGTKTWRERVIAARQVGYLVDVLREQLATLGYTHANLHSTVVPVPNSVGARMYHLVFASKHPLGQKLWNAVTRNMPGAPTLLA